MEIKAMIQAAFSTVACSDVVQECDAGNDAIVSKAGLIKIYVNLNAYIYTRYKL